MPEQTAESDRTIVARYLRKASRSPKRHPATRAAMLRVADQMQSGPNGVERVEYGVRFCGETQAEDLFTDVVEAERCVDHIRKMIRDDEYDPDDYEPIEIVRRVVTEFEPSVSEWDAVTPPRSDLVTTTTTIDHLEETP